jgi:hypothetical protein
LFLVNRNRISKIVLIKTYAATKSIIHANSEYGKDNFKVGVLSSGKLCYEIEHA